MRDQCRQVKTNETLMRDEFRQVKMNEKPMQTSEDKWKTNERWVQMSKDKLKTSADVWDASQNARPFARRFQILASLHNAESA